MAPQDYVTWQHKNKSVCSKLTKGQLTSQPGTQLKPVYLHQLVLMEH